MSTWDTCVHETKSERNLLVSGRHDLQNSITNRVNSSKAKIEKKIMQHNNVYQFSYKSQCFSLNVPKFFSLQAIVT